MVVLRVLGDSLENDRIGKVFIGYSEQSYQLSSFISRRGSKMAIYPIRQMSSLFFNECDRHMSFISQQKLVASLQTWTIKLAFSSRTSQWMAISFGPHMPTKLRSWFVCSVRAYTLMRLLILFKQVLCMQVHPIHQTRDTPTPSACVQSNVVCTMNSMALTFWLWYRPIFTDQMTATLQNRVTSWQLSLDALPSVRYKVSLWQFGAQARHYGNSATLLTWPCSFSGSHLTAICPMNFKNR